MAGFGCLNERNLKAFVLGNVSESDGLAMTAHLEGCSRCEALAQRFDRLSDPLLLRLREACSQQTLLVESDHFQEDQLLDLPSAGTGPLVPEGFAILHELGRGATGVVYLARQEHPSRLVALKMILDGGHGTPEQRARFLREADAIAKLKHPGIVQIFGVGRIGEILYSVLEYIPNGSLARRLAEHPMVPRDAAALIEHLARAIDFTHRQGIVHRDLKPANVLLGDDGNAKIVDFGLAKQGLPDLTASDAILGTPSYLAPEQASGGSRSAGPLVDVYALGAILYECLTGRPPFLAATVLETIEQVRSHEPPSPSLIQPGSPRDLVLICLKCLYKEPERRYESAEQLAEELRRFLDGAPLRHTRAVGLPERLLRWGRRNPLVAGLSAALLLLLLLSIVGAGLAVYRLREGFLRERQYATTAGEASRRAEANLAVARKIVDEMYIEFSLDLSNEREMDDYERKLLERALAFYDGTALPQCRDPALRLQASLAALRVAYIRDRLGSPTLALAAHARALALLEPLVAEYPQVSEYRRALAEGYGHRGLMRSQAGQLATARDDLQRCLSLARVLVRDEPFVESYRLELARALGNNAELASSGGRSAEAEGLYSQAVQLMEGLVAEEPQNPLYRFRLGRYLSVQAYTSEQAGRSDHGLSLHERAVRLLETLSAEFPRITSYRYYAATALSNQGASYRRAGNPTAARTALTRAAVLLERLVEEHPKYLASRADLATTSWSLALLSERTGRPGDAENHYRRAVTLLELLVRENPQRVQYWTSLGGCACNLGNVLRYARNRPRDALPYFDRAADALHEALQRKPSDEIIRKFLSETYFGRGWAYDLLGRRAETLADLERSLEFAAGPRRSWVLGRRAVTKAVYGDALGAGADAARAGADPLATVETLRDAARAYALAATIGFPGGPPGIRTTERERYQSAAITLLDRSSHHDPQGLFLFLNFLRESPNLDSLRGRRDFQALFDIGFPADPFLHQ